MPADIERRDKLGRVRYRPGSEGGCNLTAQRNEFDGSAERRPGPSGAAETQPAISVVPPVGDLHETILDQLSESVVVLDAEQRITYFNDAFARLNDITLEGWRGRSILDIVTYRHADGVDDESVLAALLADGHWQGEVRSDHRETGEERTTESTVTLLRDPDGEIAGFLAINRDITDRAHAEAALAEAEQRYRALVEQTPGVTYLDAPDSTPRWLYMSPQIEALSGYSADAWMSDDDIWCSILHPEDREWVLALDEQTNRDGEDWSADYRIIAKDGRLVWVHDVATPILDEERRVAFWQGTLTDITNRKAVEERLAFQASILENVNDAVIATDPELHLTSWNRAAEDMYGWRTEDVLGRPMHDVLRSELVDADLTEDMLNLAETGQWRGQLIQYHRSGKPLYIEAKGMPLQDGRGVIQGYVTVNRDVTERRRAEELARAAAAAEASADHANRAKSEFLSRMSHELRTPLNAILGFTQLLTMEDLTDEQRQSLEHIMSGGQHLLTLIDDVLDISRVEIDQLGLSPEPVQIQGVVSEAVDLVGFLAGARRIAVERPGGPEAERFVLADQQRLKQVLLNLLSNAIKYNLDGGTVTVTKEIPAEGTLRINISDTGPGISAEGLTRIFQPFERLGAEQTEVEGTGLGLALSKRLIEAMQGRIGVDSEVGIGSTFWVELPLADAPPAASEEPPPVEQTLFGAAARGTVLYIEDNLSNLRLVERVVGRRPGVTLLSAMQGQLGIELAAEHVPDLILLDVHLPDIPGDVVLPRLRANPATAHIPIVVISADATSTRVHGMMRAGAADYLTKPLDVSRLLAILDETLGDVSKAATD